MEIDVNLGSRSYPIIIDKGIVGSLPELCHKFIEGRSVAIVTNTTVKKLYSQIIDKWEHDFGWSVISIPDGERYKTVDTWSMILDQMVDAHLDRKSVCIALGGGVVGDIAGFASAAYLRGIDYIQVPTTLLAMVDSSVGGKTAVDHPKGKNLIGAFHQPRMVIVDTSFLDTLPDRQFVAGYAELFKYAFIGGHSMFDFVKNNKDSILEKQDGLLIEGIHRSIEIKARTVELDEFETKGLRALLNFGHTFAHSLERFFDFDALLHGEAVLWGIKCACNLGIRLGTVAKADISFYEEILDNMPLPKLPSFPDVDSVYRGMFTDKKSSGGMLRFVLPTIPGTSIVKKDVSEASVKETLYEVFPSASLGRTLTVSVKDKTGS